MCSSSVCCLIRKAMLRYSPRQLVNSRRTWGPFCIRALQTICSSNIIFMRASWLSFQAKLTLASTKMLDVNCPLLPDRSSPYGFWPATMQVCKQRGGLASLQSAVRCGRDLHNTLLRIVSASLHGTYSIRTRCSTLEFQDTVSGSTAQSE